MSSMRVYFFGGSQADGNAGMKNLLGGKGANLAEMVNLGAGGNNPTLDAGIFAPMCLGDTVWIDVAQDQSTAGDNLVVLGIPNVRLNLYQVTDGIETFVMSTLTAPVAGWMPTALPSTTTIRATSSPPSSTSAQRRSTCSAVKWSGGAGTSTSTNGITSSNGPCCPGTGAADRNTTTTRFNTIFSRRERG